jgi:hypothetical protein
MDTISGKLSVGECRQDEGVRNVRLVEDTVEHDHDGSVPAVVPKRLMARHRWDNQDLKTEK